MKAEPSRLIPRKLTKNVNVIFNHSKLFARSIM